VRTLIRNGQVVNADETVEADVLIDGERIAAVAPRIDAACDRVLDASDRLVIPGGIDAHTHLDLPVSDEVTTSDDFTSGTIAAAMGGTTSVVDYATQARGGTLASALDEWRRRADGRAAVDYGFHMIVCDLSGDADREMGAMVEQGVTSFKLFMAYPGRLMLDDDAIARVMRRAAGLRALVCMHAEDGHAIDALVRQAQARGDLGPRFHATTRPAHLETAAVRRTIALAGDTGAETLVVHVSAAESAEAIAEARRRGARVHGETCPQYLLLTEECYDEPGFGGAKYVMSPPLRPKGHGERLWEALAGGGLETVGTDHCPFWRKDKERGRGDFTRIPNGAPGIEHRMSLLFDAGVTTGRLSANRWVEVTSTAPARIFGLAPRKGRIAAGADADVVVWHPRKRTTISAATHAMRVDYNLYEGRQVVGAAESVFLRGQLIVDGGTFVGRPGLGRFVPRTTRS
jgi:dihydropyrimidinase